MIRDQFSLDVNQELIVDSFAGGGGASAGIEMALGRCVDVAVNHDPLAISLHSANHPQTRHFCEDVFKIDPREVTNGRPVALAWFSPDCKHFSKAKGGKPRSKRIRGLAWVVVKWAAIKKPRVIILENVEEFEDWGPLLADGTPCPRRKGKTFRNFVRRLEDLGYIVDWRQLRASDYGAPTIRRRLYLIARSDGRSIAWPNPTHGDPASESFSGSGLLPWRTAAECIDWSLPCPSIFLSKEEAKRLRIKRPLAEATQRRIARGIRKFVLECKEPFIVQYHSAKRPGDQRVSSTQRPLGTQTTENRFGLAFPFVAPLTHQGSDRVESICHPLKTITGANRGEKALAMPFISDASRPRECRNSSPRDPIRTQCAEVKGGHFQLVQAFLAKHYGGHETPGGRPQTPFSTVTAKDHHAIVAAHMEALYSEKANDCRGSSVDGPLKTITASPRHALFASHLSKFYGTTTGQPCAGPLHSITSQGNHIAEVRAFLQKYYGEGGQDQDVRQPMHTIPTVDRFGLVTIEGVDYQISDIGMRMLIARELYRGQGFPDNYVIEIFIDVVTKSRKVKRKRLSNEAQVRMCGNSVCPPVACALVAVNVPELAVWRNGEIRAFRRQLKHWTKVSQEAL